MITLMDKPLFAAHKNTISLVEIKSVVKNSDEFTRRVANWFQRRMEQSFHLMVVDVLDTNNGITYARFAVNALVENVLILREGSAGCRISGQKFESKVPNWADRFIVKFTKISNPDNGPFTIVEINDPVTKQRLRYRDQFYLHRNWQAKYAGVRFMVALVKMHNSILA